MSFRRPEVSAAEAVIATELAEELLTATPGKRLAYATDLADSAENRKILIALAHNAHTLFLEAVFGKADVAQARLHGHLTARACGEIAAAAGVSRLVPFHLSRRYVDYPQRLFEEIEAVCGCAIQPVWQAENPAASGGSQPPALHHPAYPLD